MNTVIQQRNSIRFQIKELEEKVASLWLVYDQLTLKLYSTSGEELSRKGITKEITKEEATELVSKFNPVINGVPSFMHQQMNADSISNASLTKEVIKTCSVEESVENLKGHLEGKEPNTYYNLNKEINKEMEKNVEINPDRVQVNLPTQEVIESTMKALTEAGTKVSSAKTLAAAIRHQGYYTMNVNWVKHLKELGYTKIDGCWLKHPLIYIYDLVDNDSFEYNSLTPSQLTLIKSICKLWGYDFDRISNSLDYVENLILNEKINTIDIENYKKILHFYKKHLKSNNFDCSKEETIMENLI